MAKRNQANAGDQGIVNIHLAYVCGSFNGIANLLDGQVTASLSVS